MEIEGYCFQLEGSLQRHVDARFLHFSEPPIHCKNGVETSGLSSELAILKSSPTSLSDRRDGMFW